jgi:putative transposase
MLVTRVELHIVDMNQQLIDLSYASKNLYNCATFIMYAAKFDKKP